MDKVNNEKDEILIIEERITKVNGDFFIKKYSRGKLLGKGGFAKVYNFTVLENNKVLAGKVMPKAELERSRARQKVCILSCLNLYLPKSSSSFCHNKFI